MWKTKRRNCDSTSPKLCRYLRSSQAVVSLWMYMLVSFCVVVVHVDTWDYVTELRPPTGLLFIPQMIYEYGDPVVWYWQEKTEELWGKPVPVILWPPQIPHGLTWARTRLSTVRGRRLTDRGAWVCMRVTVLRLCACVEVKFKVHCAWWKEKCLPPPGIHPHRSVLQGTLVRSSLISG
jgi:hypothetical protein